MLPRQPCSRCGACLTLTLLVTEMLSVIVSIMGSDSSL